MKRKTKVLITCFLSAVFIALCGFVIKSNIKISNMELMIKNNYNQSLTDLATYLDNITATLTKENYCTSKSEMSALCSKLSADTSAAKICLERLPIAPENTSAIYKLLSQAGDYSIYLSKTNVNEVTADELLNLKKLTNYSKIIAEKINEIESVASQSHNGKYWTDELETMLKSTNDELSSLNASLLDIEQANADYPTLIYDGPFSDHLLIGTPKLISDKKQIGQENAKTIAAEYIGIAKDALNFSSIGNGNVPTYIFESDKYQIAVTQKGGEIIYLNSSRDVEKSVLSYNDALKKAKEYLKARYKNNFSESYYIIDNGICTINFAYEENGIICYPDLIKVGVALDNGEILSVEAANYIMNHNTNRDMNFKYSKSDAVKLCSKSLTVVSDKKCVINVNTDKEYCCYEFMCKDNDGQDVLVYIDANDLTQREILLVEKTAGGVLTK